MSYDFVCETILKLAKCKSDIPKLVTEFIKKTAYKVIGYWSHLLAGHIWLNYSRKNSTCKRLKSIKLSRIVFIIYLQKRKDPKILRSTKKIFRGYQNNRFQIRRLLVKIICMLRSHIPEKGSHSICNHRSDGGGTEGNHIIQIKAKNIVRSCLISFPCENDYTTLQLFQQQYGNNQRG